MENLLWEFKKYIKLEYLKVLEYLDKHKYIEKRIKVIIKPMKIKIYL